jgi:hypothetical protein
MMILRGIAFAAGLALLAATAHTTIGATGGYAGPHAVLTLAIAAGVGIGRWSSVRPGRPDGAGSLFGCWRRSSPAKGSDC